MGVNFNMPTRISLLCHGRTQAQRHGRFALDDEPLAAGEAQRLAARVAEIKAPRRILCAPEVRRRCACAGTATWSCSTSCAIATTAPGAGAAWRRGIRSGAGPGRVAERPGQQAHGGESQAHLCARSRLAGRLRDDGHVLVVSHPAVIRARSARTGGAEAFKSIDVAPLALVDLRFHGRWRLRV
jgi:broad specificity phosphatase PhoE